MNRKMYELIIPDNQLPVFWMNDEEKILRQITDPKAVASQYESIERYRWCPKSGWIIRPANFNSTKLTFPLMSVDAGDLVSYLKDQLPEAEKLFPGEVGNYIVAHRRVKNIVHVGFTIIDAITERPINWLD